MKKLLLLLTLFFIGFTANGQNLILNGNFELWDSATIDYPLNYPNTSNSQNYFRFKLPPNITKSTDAYHGTYAVQLITNTNGTDTASGYFFNISPEKDPSAWTGGMPYDQKPTGIRGYYKYNVDLADSGTLIVIFSNAGINIGSYMLPIGGNHDSYALFKFTFNPALTVTPDSVAFGALACKLADTKNQPQGLAGTILLLDSISFTGVTSQPALLNGDFELWQQKKCFSPFNWNIQSDNGEGFSKTNDAYSGKYAIELNTYLGNRDNKPIARQGSISNGFYAKNCNGNCKEQGGFPFSGKIDTLAFYYKYFPSGSDSANINIGFKQNGNSFWGRAINLPATATYKYIEVPIKLEQNPDSVLIKISSSLEKDTVPSFVGSDLIIDDIHFKSQETPTNILKINTIIRICPNPSNGTFFIQGLEAKIKSLEIFNVNGTKVYSLLNITKLAVQEINLSKSPKGIYFIKINTDGKLYNQKIVIQ